MVVGSRRPCRSLTGGLHTTTVVDRWRTGIRRSRLFQYPFQTRGAVTITSEDVLRLNDGEFLNDSLIDFQIKWITEHAGPENLARCIVYNSFFHRKIKHLWSVLSRGHR